MIKLNASHTSSFAASSANRLMSPSAKAPSPAARGTPSSQPNAMKASLNASTFTPAPAGAKAMKAPISIPPSGGIKISDLLPSTFPVFDLKLDSLLKLNFKPVDFAKFDFKPSNFDKLDFKPATFDKLDFKPADFSRLGFKPSDFRKLNFKPADFSRLGFKGGDLVRMGFKANDLKQLGLKPSDVRSLKFTLNDFSKLGFDMPARPQLAMAFAAVKNLGVGQLRALGVKDPQFLKSLDPRSLGMSAKELKQGAIRLAQSTNNPFIGPAGPLLPRPVLRHVDPNAPQRYMSYELDATTLRLAEIQGLIVGDGRVFFSNDLAGGRNAAAFLQGQGIFAPLSPQASPEFVRGVREVSALNILLRLGDIFGSFEPPSAR